ncbi:MAG TPA: Fe-S metabolism protein SufE [Anaerolineaceae bacterium]|jgi:cysteine desulfuration protein SufE|nr:Fe-S metabolism protein SufE [Anaerolineaceae bacterium]
MMATVAELEAELIDNFNLLETWEEKYDYLIELGQELAPMDPTQKTEENRVKGCQSSVWFDITCKDGRLYFDADSDSLIVKGLVAILHQLLNGQPVESFADVNLTVFETLGFWRHLSSQRSNGLTAMVAHLRAAAAECAQAKA